VTRYDLLLQGGTLIDPLQGRHAPRDVAFSERRVARVDARIPASEAARTVDVSGLLVVPGMIDLHVHVFEGVSYLGIPPDQTCLARGVTTVVDAGTSGADTFPGFRKYVIEASATRIYAHLNISSQGMLSPAIGELDEIKWADVPRALQTIEANRDRILGVKVRLTRNSVVGRAAGLKPLYHAREAADAAGLPVMVHPQDAWCASLDDVLAVMQAGDILTHSYHGHNHGILDEDGKIRPAVRAARARGVLFDVGHGAGSFSWQTCETALAQEFLPDTISTDLHTRNVHGPVYDLATTVSKFLHLGLTLDEALAKVTAVPAHVLGDAALVDAGGARIGTLAVGAWGDAVVLELRSAAVDLVDCHQQVRHAGQLLVPRLVVAGGRIYEGAAAPVMHVH